MFKLCYYNLTFACSKEIRYTPKDANRAKNAIGAQHMKSVNTSRAILLAIRESLEFHAYKEKSSNKVCKFT